MSLIECHKTTTKELLALTHKVRNLVTHWGEDGRYKEAVLQNIIKRFLPQKYSIGSGFVVKPGVNRGEHVSSRQLDVIIYDNESPVLFKEGDFVILTADAVRGIIEVKANLQNQGVVPIVRQANENGQFIFSGKHDKTAMFFNGIFSFEGYVNPNINVIRENMINANEDFSNDPDYQRCKVNHISFNKDWFLRFWQDEEMPHSIYHLEDLSFSFFISNLIDALANNSVERNNFIWFATDKELDLVRKF
jgi:hypothetical protein